MHLPKGHIAGHEHLRLLKFFFLRKMLCKLYEKYVKNYKNANLLSEFNWLYIIIIIVGSDKRRYYRIDPSLSSDTVPPIGRHFLT